MHKVLPYLFILLSLTHTAKASASDDCGPKLVRVTLADSLSHLASAGRLEKETRVVVETSTSVSPGAINPGQIERQLKLRGHNVSITVLPPEFAGQMRMSLSGKGRDIAQALLVLDQPNIGGSVLSKPRIWNDLDQRAGTQANEPQPTKSNSELDRLLLRNLFSLNLSTPIRKALHREKIYLIGDLVHHDRQLLRRIRGVGDQAINKISERLAELGLSLNMNVPSWPPENDEGLFQLKFAKNWATQLEWVDLQNATLAELSTLFDPNGNGPTLERPWIKVYARELQKDFVIVLVDHFIENRSDRLSRSIDFIYPLRTEFKMESLIRDWQANIDKLTPQPVSALSGERSLETFRQIMNTNTPALIRPIVRDANRPHRGWLVIPIPGQTSRIDLRP